MNFLEGIEVKIANNLIIDIDLLLQSQGFANKKICFVSDEKIWKNCTRFFPKNFKPYKSLILKNPKPNEKNINLIKKTTSDCKIILALGSGTINDLCKFVSAQTNIPYIIIASAPSMNGYLSRNASITIRGHKKTLLATLPLAVYCDLKILKSAPKKMIQAGIGDSICLYSCWFDWLLSHLILGTKFDLQPFKMLHKKMQFLLKNYQNFKLQDEKLLQILIEILLLSGAGMTIAGGSYPASQSEHLIAHAFEMKYPKKADKILHGLQIAITTQTAAILQESLLSKDFLQLQKAIFPLLKMQKFFDKKIALACKKEYEEKINFDLNKINQQLKKNWKNHRKILAKILLPQKSITKILCHFKINHQIKTLSLSNKQYQELASNAKFIRNRFTCLDLS